MITATDITLRTILDALTAAGPPAGVLNGSLMNLYQNDFTPSPTTILADMIVADFTGYAESAAMVWAPALTVSAGVAAIVADNVQFLATDGVTPNTIFGYWIQTTAGVLIWAERFVNSVGVIEDGDGVNVVGRFQQENLAVV